MFQTVGDSKPIDGQRDVIGDFNAAAGDRIDLSAIDANARLAGNQSFTLGGDHLTGRAGELVQTLVGTNLLVQGDLNGDGRADFSFVVAGQSHALGAEAFVL